MAKRLCLIVLLVALPGCGGLAMYDQLEKSSFFLISKGKASGLAAMITGEVDYCKITQHNLEGSEYVVDVTYNDDTCSVQATASAAQQ